MSRTRTRNKIRSVRNKGTFRIARTNRASDDGTGTGAPNPRTSDLCSLWNNQSVTNTPRIIGRSTSTMDCRSYQLYLSMYTASTRRESQGESVSTIG
ncbi:hypothetical protein C8Q74DRAFT_66514 [Fomes fomentarius]|nr:hypothetical protein C8Q74DRAFT_66514 [Fomes fomentarius]